MAIVGVSGVGKSTLLHNLSKRLEFQHLQASVLIKEQIRFETGEGVIHDDLRKVNIDENQRLLISGFQRCTAQSTGLIVLDAHTLIDTPSGFVEIPPAVFQAMGVSRFIFIYASAEDIGVRREADSSRARPTRSVVELATQQNAAQLAAFTCALALNLPLHVVSASDTLLVERLLSNPAGL